jgi:fructose-1-phosphate kinase PfkB-like protein
VEFFMSGMNQYLDADFWSIGGSLAKGLPETLYRDLIRLGNSKGVRVVLDSYGVPFNL